MTPAHATTSQPSPPTSSPLAMGRFAGSILAASLLLTLLWYLAACGYWEDDAYIHLEFARSFAAGHGFTFNGHLVYGDTSPLWVWLLVATHALLPDWLLAGKLLTVVAAVFTLSGVFLFARSLVRLRLHNSAANLFAAAMLLVFVLNPYFGYWAFSGMEALAAAGLVCWGCALIAPHHMGWKRVLSAALLAGLAPLLRPEMAFFTLLLGCVLFQRIRHMRYHLVLRIDVLVAALVLLSAPTVAWGVYALHRFGSLLPNTNAAKRAAPADSVLTRLEHVYAFGFPVTVLACLLLGGWLLWYLLRGRRQGAASVHNYLHAGGWLLFLWTAIDCLFYLADHTFVQTRYLFVTAPALTIAVFALAAMRWPSLYRNLLTVALLFSAVVSVVSTLPQVRNKVVVDASYAQLADQVRRLPPSAPVALYAIGEVAFLSQHPIVDTGGITRPGVIPYLGDPSGDRVTAWARTQGAQYEVIDHAPTPGAELLWSRSVPISGWYFNPRRYSATDRLQLWKLPPPPQGRLLDLTP